MKVSRESLVSGIVRERELDCTPEQMDAWERGVPAQVAFPQLNASDREFIITGMTDDEWDDTFWNGDEDYNEDGEEE